jgi:hypothetical protein
MQSICSLYCLWGQTLDYTYKLNAESGSMHLQYNAQHEVLFIYLFIYFKIVSTKWLIFKISFYIIII